MTSDERIWGPRDERGYAQEISTLEANNAGCPKCGLTLDVLIGKRILQPEVADGDLKLWSGNCRCGTHLTIFND